MIDVTYRRINVDPTQLKYVLQTKWMKNGVEILLVSRDSAWTGEVHTVKINA